MTELAKVLKKRLFGEVSQAKSVAATNNDLKSELSGDSAPCKG